MRQHGDNRGDTTGPDHQPGGVGNRDRHPGRQLGDGQVGADRGSAELADRLRVDAGAAR
jgi:hypothetical protein